MTTLDDLIARLEKATGADAELNTAIHEAVHGRLGALQRPQRYTGSLDAAMTLIRPDADFWDVGMIFGEAGYMACVSVAYDGNGSVLQNGKGATPALALTIAALKARKARP